MRPISLNNQVKFLLCVGTLVGVALFGIKNRQNGLIVDSSSHVDVTLKVTHQDTVFSLGSMVFHNFKFIVRVNYRLFKFYEVRTANGAI
jgi:hypothetical protein